MEAGAGRGHGEGGIFHGNGDIDARGGDSQLVKTKIT